MAVRDALTELLTDEAEAGDALRALVRLFGWYKVRTAVSELLGRPDVAGWQQWIAHSAEELATTWNDRTKSLLTITSSI